MSGIVLRSYTTEDKQQAIGHFLVIGNVKATAEKLSIPRSTLRGWMQTEWWQKTLEAARQAQQAELDAMHTRIIQATGEAILDRLENGDAILNANGELVRKPMSGRDMATIHGIMFDKRQISRNMPTSIRGGSVDEKLKELLMKFEHIANEKVVTDE